MSHAQHRAPRSPRRLPTLAAATAGPLALVALGLVAAPTAQAMVPAGAGGVVPTAAPAVTTGSYTVQAGDTLAAIARKLGVPGGWQALAAANTATLPNPNVLRVGQRLVVPGGGSTPSTPSTGTAPGPGVSSGSGSGSGSPSGSGSSTGASMVAYAKTFLGTRYVWGGMSRSGVDCSGLTSLVLRQAGYSPPRTANAQYGWVTKISASQARPGDLVFGYFSGGRVGHVGIYAGNGQMIDSPTSGQVVGVHTVSRDARYGRPPARG